MLSIALVTVVPTPAATVECYYQSMSEDLRPVLCGEGHLLVLLPCIGRGCGGGLWLKLRNTFTPTHPPTHTHTHTPIQGVGTGIPNFPNFHSAQTPILHETLYSTHTHTYTRTHTHQLPTFLHSDNELVSGLGTRGNPHKLTVAPLTNGREDAMVTIKIIITGATRLTPWILSFHLIGHFMRIRIVCRYGGCTNGKDPLISVREGGVLLVQLHIHAHVWVQ